MVVLSISLKHALKLPAKVVVVAVVVTAVVAVAATAVVVAIGTNPYPSLYSFTGEGWSLPVFALFLFTVSIPVDLHSDRPLLLLSLSR
jgi:hypothetical protein